jgi:sugar lactone lactonase YvrE
MDAPSHVDSVPASSTRRRRRRRRMVALAAVVVIGAGAAVAGSQRAGSGRSGTMITLLVERVETAYRKQEGGAQTFSFPFGVAANPTGLAVLVSMTANMVYGPTPEGTPMVAREDGFATGASAVRIAGNGNRASVDGPATQASFAEPCGVTVDSSGAIFVADGYGGRIRKISGGVVTTVAGGGGSGLVNGQGAKAQFNQPCGLASDAAGNLYVADTNNHAIRKITNTGAVTTLAGNGTAGYTDGTGSAARFTAPWGVAVDSNGNVFVADSGNHRIRRITPTGVVTTVAGSGVAGYADGVGTRAAFNNPSGVAVRGDGTLFVADTDNHRIRRIAPDGTVTSLAGDGAPGLRDSFNEPLSNAQFSRPYGVAVASANALFVADTFNSLIRKVVFKG